MACIHPTTVIVCVGCFKRTWYTLDHDTDDSSARKYVKMQQEPRRKHLHTTTVDAHEEKKVQKFRPGGAVLGAAAAKEFNAAKAEAAEAAAKAFNAARARAFPKVAKAEAAKAFNAAKACCLAKAFNADGAQPMSASNQIPGIPVSWIAEPERKKLKKAQSAPW